MIEQTEETEKLKYVYRHKYVMAHMTLSIPDELLSKMKQFKEIKWSEVARAAIEKRVNDLIVVEKIASKSKLTEKDVEEIAKSVNSSVAKKLGLK